MALVSQRDKNNAKYGFIFPSIKRNETAPLMSNPLLHFPQWGPTTKGIEQSTTDTEIISAGPILCGKSVRKLNRISTNYRFRQ